jgi:ATP-dependent Lon protease
MLAAHRFGLKTIILSKENEKDLVEIPEEVRDDLTIHAVDTIDEVLKLALEGEQAAERISTPQIWNTETQPGEATATLD